MRYQYTAIYSSIGEWGKYFVFRSDLKNYRRKMLIPYYLSLIP